MRMNAGRQMGRWGKGICVVGKAWYGKQYKSAERGSRWQKKGTGRGKAGSVTGCRKVWLQITSRTQTKSNGRFNL